MNNPLPVLDRIALSPADPFEVKHNMLTHTPHLQDARTLQYCSYFSGRRLEWLRLFTEPYRFDGVACNPCVQATGNRFDLGQLWHGNPVYGIVPGLPPLAQHLRPLELNL